jgi:transcriptional regulator with PAS, ATPase and Fis domain
MDVQQIKQRFGIIGASDALNRALDISAQVASTDLSVLVTGESGVGKERFPQIIHQYSVRKHGVYIAVNCGAIPEGTIDSELFGHEKGAFTGAHDTRKGYFEVADKGTIFLDEVGELPLSSQVRLLRVLETGEFIKVGSSKVQKTDVRVVAATNTKLREAIRNGKFREDLYYRLNTVPIYLPPLRERREDIYLLFRKFTQDFSEKYQVPPIRLASSAREILKAYTWPGNIRQLKNIAEQLSAIEVIRDITPEILQRYLPSEAHNLPAIFGDKALDEKTFASEREILYKILFDMKNDMNDLKRLVRDIIENRAKGASFTSENIDNSLLRNLYTDEVHLQRSGNPMPNYEFTNTTNDDTHIEDTEELHEETLSIEAKEIELIRKALEKYGNRRKSAAKDLGISERTLYRKIKEYNIT